MQTGDTIIACATAPGLGARAIVRLSGPASFEAIAGLDCGTAPGEHRERGVRAARIRLGDSHQLPCLIAEFPAPRSYTGEDVIEIAIPANPTLIERVIASAIDAAAGVRMANPGEFTARAYLNDRLTLAQAEGIGSLIAAQGADELVEARRLLSGERGKHYHAFADEAMTLLALVEAGIDFTDQEDVVAICGADLRERAARLAKQIEQVLGSASGTEAQSEVPRVALAGVPNAGKSTLFNAILGRRRAVVSDEAGTTRDVLEERLDLSRDISGGGEVLLCDTPGVDTGSNGNLDGRAQAASRSFLASADVVVWCDPTGRFDDAALDVPRRVRTIRVRTKADLPRVSGAVEALEVSALDGFHLPSLRRAIADAALGGGVRAGVLPRHRRALRAAAGELRAMELELAATGRNISEPELVAGRLRAALDCLGELTGRMTPDDVIGRVFATFCVGK
ncbi:MAG: 50S ribosome-binding GTPase [Phycisphaeraceae bacterium]|nr:50S ribosome-binding GTPase [Phycisphaeraceae bacterium]